MTGASFAVAEEVSHVTRQCQANMHLHCDDAMCACPVCHHWCHVCGALCRSVYTVPDHEKVDPDLRGKSACAVCYSTATLRMPRGQGCEVCGAPHGYRSLARDPEGLYRCGSCHEKAGTAVPGPPS